MKVATLGVGDQLAKMVYKDRSEAGKRLASALEAVNDQNPIVLGLARGGVVLAAEVAKQLDATLDVLVCQKVSAPDQPEYAIGAVAPGGIMISDSHALRQLNISASEFLQMAQKKAEEVNRRLKAYRDDRPDLDLRGRTVIIVDDGLATGTTAVAASEYARKLGAANVILAVPVCSSYAAELLRNQVDELICLSVPPSFHAVGQWYRDFDQVSDEEVIALLNSANSAPGI